MKDICIFFATGFEEIEALTVVDILRRGQLPVKMVSVTGERTVTSSHQVSVQMDALLAEVNFEQVEMIVLPGGMPGTKNLEACEELMQQVDAFYAAGRPLAAICAAPSIFGHKGMLKGKNACSFPEFESHLEGAAVSKEACVVDGNIITARGMGCAIEFGLHILAKYQGEEAAEKMAAKIVFQRTR